MKQLKTSGNAIDFKVLETLTEQEWADWIQSRMQGYGTIMKNDLFGFPIGGMRDGVSPSECFYEVRDKIKTGVSFPTAESAIREIIRKEITPATFNTYHVSELTTIAENVTLPHLGYETVTQAVAEWLKKECVDTRKRNGYDVEGVISSLRLLIHMQKFEDRQFVEVYQNFLRPRDEFHRLDLPRIYLHAFLGLQIAHDLTKVDEDAVRKILDLNKGDERELANVFCALGNVIKEKYDYYRKNSNSNQNIGGK